MKLLSPQKTMNSWTSNKKDKISESKNSHDVTSKLKYTTDNEVIESVSASFSQSSSSEEIIEDKISNEKTPESNAQKKQLNHMITLRRKPHGRMLTQSTTYAYGFVQGKDPNSWSIYDFKKSNPTQTQIDLVKIRIIREINNNPSTKNLPIEEK